MSPGSGETAVVVVAAGRGERAGQSDEGPKQYRFLGSRTVLRRTLEAFAAHEGIGRIVVAIHPEDRYLFAASAAGLDGVLAVDGGSSRQASTLLALEALAADPPLNVLIHDAVRPFVDEALIERVIGAIDDGRGALPALPVADTLKREGSGGLVAKTVQRAGLHAAQTPQGFRFAEILGEHRRAADQGHETFTDDAAIAEWAGLEVALVPGSADNVKLTWARDIEMARAREQQAGFPDIRTGNGYDVHRFAEGDHVTLCGVSIPFDRRLDGHSDADVGLHALTDALLATCGAGDIGTHFPPSDPQWRDAPSRIFVQEAARRVRAAGGRIANADVTIIAEAPKIGPHRAAMVEAVSTMLAIAPERVSVKATTNERLGFIGRGEGIAAIATTSVAYPGVLPE